MVIRAQMVTRRLWPNETRNLKRTKAFCTSNSEAWTANLIETKYAMIIHDMLSDSWVSVVQEVRLESFADARRWTQYSKPRCWTCWSRRAGRARGWNCGWDQPLKIHGVHNLCIVSWTCSYFRCICIYVEMYEHAEPDSAGWQDFGGGICIGIAPLCNYLLVFLQTCAIRSPNKQGLNQGQEGSDLDWHAPIIPLPAFISTRSRST